MTLDLSILPPRRADKVREAYDRERAAERIRAVYPMMNQRWTEAEAFRRTAAALAAEGYPFVTARWVQRVMREGR